MHPHFKYTLLRRKQGIWVGPTAIYILQVVGFFGLETKNGRRPVSSVCRPYKRKVCMYVCMCVGQSLQQYGAACFHTHIWIYVHNKLHRERYMIQLMYHISKIPMPIVLILVFEIIVHFTCNSSRILPNSALKTANRDRPSRHFTMPEGPSQIFILVRKR